MRNFHVERTIRSPLISVNTDSGQILMQGRSYPENAVEFYQPFIEWLSENGPGLPGSVVFTMDMEYFNTSTSGILYQLITDISNMRSGHVKIIWKYEADDIDMLNKGQSLKSHFGDIFELEEKPM